MRRNAFAGAILVSILAFPLLMTSQQKKAEPPKTVRLYVFDCGSLNIPDISPYQLKKEEIRFWVLHSAGRGVLERVKQAMDLSDEDLAF